VLFVCGGWGTLLWCAYCAEGLGAFRRRRVSIALHYYLEYLGGGQISLGSFFVLDVLVERDVCVSWFPRRGEGEVEVVLVELVWGVEGGGVVGLPVAALSSGA
jgi:hypothetical protein